MLVILRGFALLALAGCLGAAPPQMKTAAPKKAAPPPSNAVAAKKSALDKTTLEAFVRHLVLYPPQIKITVSDPKPSDLPGFVEVTVNAAAGNASENRVFYVSTDGRKILQAAVYDIDKNPFHKELDKLKTDLEPSLGIPGAPVVVVMFSDFQCTYCREEGKMIRENLVQTYPAQVRLYFKDFPLVQVHPWAKPAAIAGRCIFRQNPAAFWDYHDWIFENQGQITPQNLRDKVLEFAKSKNLDLLQLPVCLDSKSADAEVEKSMAEGRELGVNSTPTIFINGRRITFSIKWPNLKQVIDFEIDYQKVAQNAGERCCEVKLANPLNP